MIKTVFAVAVATLVCLSPAAADAIYNFQIDTSTVGSGASGYSLDLFFIDGGDGTNNTATLSVTGGGSATLQDTFFTEQQLGFPAGPLLRLRLATTTNPDLGSFVSPDAFSIALLHNGVQVPTVDPTGGNALISVTLPVTAGGSPTVVFADSPDGTFQPGFATEMPEPSTFAFSALALGLLCITATYASRRSRLARAR